MYQEIIFMLASIVKVFTKPAMKEKPGNRSTLICKI